MCGGEEHGSDSCWRPRICVRSSLHSLMYTRRVRADSCWSGRRLGDDDGEVEDDVEEEEEEEEADRLEDVDDVGEGGEEGREVTRRMEGEAGRNVW